MLVSRNFSFEVFKFPAGESQVRLDGVVDHRDYSLSLEFDFESQDEIFTILLICNALKHMSLRLDELKIGYLPFGRQDRVEITGESFSLEVFAGLINSCNIKKVLIDDPHSDVGPALIKRSEVIPQYKIHEQILYMILYPSTFVNSKIDRPKICLVCPDAGAAKKIYKLSKEYHGGMIHCRKQRNPKDGTITGVALDTDDVQEDKTYVIIDDICDGGRTFIEIAKVLRDKGAKKVILSVTHGLFTKGLEVFDGLIDEIYTKNGKVK